MALYIKGMGFDWQAVFQILVMSVRTFVCFLLCSHVVGSGHIHDIVSLVKECIVSA